MGSARETIAVTDLRAGIDAGDLVVDGDARSRLRDYREVADAHLRFARPSPDDRHRDTDPFGDFVELTYAADSHVWELLDGDLLRRSRDPLRRVRIWADDDAADFPFEAAAHADHGPLVLSPRLSLVRAIPTDAEPRPNPPEHLVVAAAMFPTAPGVPELDLHDDLRAVQSAVVQAQGVLGHDVLTFEEFTDETPLEIGRALRLIDQPTALIICGHAIPGHLGVGDRWLPIGDLLEALHDVDLRLVVLASCSSATGSTDASTARLAAAGIPLAVGMSALAEQRSTRHFTQGLLTTLLEGATIDEAVRAGRQRIADHVRLRQHSAPVLVTSVTRQSDPVPFASAIVAPGPTPELGLAPAPGPGRGPGPTTEERQASTAAVTAAAAVEGIAEPPLGSLAAPSLPRTFPRHRFGAYLPRTALVERVEAALLDQELVVLGGRRGCGKTHLARTVCLRSDAELIWWINAESEAAVIRQLATLARHLGIAGDAEPSGDADLVGEAARTAAAASVAWLEATSSRWLLVLDNLDDPAQVDRWLPRGRRGSGTLVTMIDPATRPGLLEQSIPIGTLDHDEAVEMLRLVTGLVDPSGMADLAELLDRLPIALYQAGSYINEHFVSVPDFTRRLTEDIATIGDGVADVVCRIGLAELEPAQARFFRTLCHLDIDALPQQLVRSAATERALGMTDADIDRTIRKLRRSGLIEVDRRAGALRIHRLTARLALKAEQG